MKHILYILSLLLLTSCYTHIQTTNPDRVTHLLAINAAGDTTQVDINTFSVNYPARPVYYNDWLFYWNNQWISPYTYYHRHYIPYTYRRKWYSPYPTYNPKPTTYNQPTRRVEPQRESKPRGNGTTPKKSTRDDNKPSTRTTGRTRNQ